MNRAPHHANVRPHPSTGVDLLELETFLAVAELGSFSLAAQSLHVTQPSVTGRVQRLETALGTRLLIRTTRKVEPTADGEALMAEATAALTGLRQVVGRFRDRARHQRDRVVIASTPVLAALTLPPIIRDYGRRFTDVEVLLRDLRYSDVLQALEDGSADLALLAFEGDDPRFVATPLESDELVLVVPSHHPLAARPGATLEEIAPHPLLVIEQYEPLRRRIADELERRGVAIAPSVTVENLHTLIGMLDAGMGATMLPTTMARRSVAAGHAIVEIDGMRLVRNFAIVRAAGAPFTTAANSFGDFLRKAFTLRDTGPRQALVSAS